MKILARLEGCLRETIRTERLTSVGDVLYAQQRSGLGTVVDASSSL